MRHASQTTLFDVTATQDGPSEPRCRMCTRPARWIPKHHQWGTYCGPGGQACNNRERICQSCRGPFHVNVDGAGTKYCSPACKRSGYGVAYVKAAINCAWCAKPGDDKRASHRGGWPYICRECMEPIKHVESRLKKHHVSADRARALIADPHCESCGVDVVVKVRDINTGRARALLVIDHDHRCCPGSFSCGECVRGLICFNCNVAAGMLGDDPDRAHAMAKYLERFRVCVTSRNRPRFI